VLFIALFIGIIVIGCFHLLFPVMAIKWGTWCYRYFGKNEFIWEDEERGMQINKRVVLKYRYLGCLMVAVGIIVGIRNNYI